MDDFENFGKRTMALLLQGLILIVGLQIFIVFAAIVGVGLEFLFGPTPLGRIALFVLVFALSLLGIID